MSRVSVVAGSEPAFVGPFENVFTPMRLRRAVDAVTVAVGRVALALLILAWLPQRTPQAPRIDGTAVGIDFAAAPLTLILVLQESCPACAMSLPFYRRVVNHSVAREVQIVVAAPESDPPIDPYLSAHAVTPDSIVSVARDELPVLFTPTLLLVDAAGLVLHGWLGVLSPRLEDEVLAVIGGDLSVIHNQPATRIHSPASGQRPFWMTPR